MVEAKTSKRKEEGREEVYCFHVRKVGSSPRIKQLPYACKGKTKESPLPPRHTHTQKEADKSSGLNMKEKKKAARGGSPYPGRDRFNEQPFLTLRVL